MAYTAAHALYLVTPPYWLNVPSPFTLLCMTNIHMPNNVRMQALGGLLLLGYLIGAFGQAFPGLSGSTPSSAAASGSSSSSAPQLYSYDLVDTFPHDPDAFTQGLDYDKVNGQDVFWESTGTAIKSALLAFNS